VPHASIAGGKPIVDGVTSAAEFRGAFFEQTIGKCIARHSTIIPAANADRILEECIRSGRIKANGFIFQCLEWFALASQMLTAIPTNV